MLKEEVSVSSIRQMAGRQAQTTRESTPRRPPSPAFARGRPQIAGSTHRYISFLTSQHSSQTNKQVIHLFMSTYTCRLSLMYSPHRRVEAAQRKAHPKALIYARARVSHSCPRWERAERAPVCAAWCLSAASYHSLELT